jgi:hypothetical protein
MRGFCNYNPINTMEKQRSPTFIHKQNDLFWEQAPDALLEKIAEFSTAINRYRQVGYNHETLSFYESILRTMRLAYMYMQDTRHIHQRNAILEANIRYLADYNRQIESQLDEIMTVSRLKMDNRLEEVLDLSDRYVESVLSVRKNLQENHG